MTARTTLNLCPLRTEPDSYDFTIEPADPLVTYIRHRLPNSKSPAERDAEILNNEHAIRRWVEGWS